MKLRQAPPRAATGAFVLHTGLQKWKGDDATAEMLHGMACGTYPVFKKLTPQQFQRLLACGEIATGTLLLTPFVPGVVAGAALTGFASALLGLYARTPGMRQPGSVWPTQEGIALAKDSWMLGVGLGLLADAVAEYRGQE
ncbi:hypothetical protein NMG29_07845 [Streptomyces cocklensis]|jgi:hypothetical protein|uniref:DoxX family membrane protein n=1 Tax=Actinacidiphila cocklensis TaxID=887465 RepID=A0A9W4GR02_9ACTN|nr:hypothetical protein [Actinacidiphila cocklensis]MDD1058139.1 hypothetical protein [Actinacidiphila cocklensis]WSX79441.1 hypothetical protein OH826_39705 [Streptomyces sp. NBC_00899]CAG6393180.1 conserved hypothetical protein [Actinacidiphila cocklensis]